MPDLLDPDDALSAFARQTLISLMPAWAEEDIQVLQRLEGGYSNTNVLISRAGRRYVLRLPGTIRSHLDRGFEQRWWQRLPPGLSVRCLVIREDGAMLTEWADGPLLVEEEPDIDSCLSYLQRLHHMLPPCERHYSLDALVSQWAGNDALASRASKALRRSLPVDEPAPVTCHNDLNPWNVIASRPWLTLDWEFVGRNDPVFDVVTLLFGVGFEEAVVSAAACEYADADTVRVHGNVLAFWLREYAWAVGEIAAGNELVEVHRQRTDAGAKLRELLS